ncbi:MAG TPA: tetratricopeptide repeat protein [Terriglobales bacterium]|nr:tetratricopeptide repeat protein [Terriglobales bacterium]
MNWSRANSFVQKPPAVLLILSLAAVLGFIVVGRLVRAFDSRQRTIAADMYHRGLTDRRNRDLKLAANHFRAALSFDRNNFAYQLNLAESLAALGKDHDDQARTYFLNLWDRAPQNGQVNLELARLAAHDNQLDEALRYYHNAIYGIWDDPSGASRRQTRLELVDFLLAHNENAQAKAELIASAAGLPPDPAPHSHIAERLLRANDYNDALGQYRAVLELDHKNADAMRGAGQAAFLLGDFRTAQRYLQQAREHGVHDDAAGQMLQTADLVLRNDPFRRRLSDKERRQRILTAFSRAGQRLQDCAQQKGEDLDTSGTPLQSLHSQWTQLKPGVARAYDSGHSDIAETAMDLVFQIEQQTARDCGPPTGLDQALLLIANNRDGADR